MATCSNGHEISPAQRFCGTCGVATADGLGVCAQGHPNPESHIFCGQCGAPLVAPADSGPGGRWTVDPSFRHQYRFWNGVTWTAHVADNGMFGVEAVDRKPKRNADTWLGVAAGLVLVVLVVGAISATAMVLSRNGQPSTAATAEQDWPPVLNVEAPATAFPARVPPTETVSRPLAAVGGTCPPGSINGVTADGSIAYCNFLADANSYLWSLYPGDIDSPYPPGTNARDREDPGIAVCMAQTGKSRTACDAQLPKPQSRNAPNNPRP